ncbi:hypothetical protein [Marinilabilia rubra]|uniref:Uncharacterized protein n=1 Tax=Marinilabilia rubra TaxID=2162893 RepID=A0A2U2B858_9BACT|nr:hypothetical protein [Marinilabilia rubra]PWD99247.1 hypothetical protein DDZ16_11680 [Marinilabilia rubra]
MKTSVFFTIIFTALTINVNATNPNNELLPPSENVLSVINEATEENLEIAEWMLDENTFETEYAIMEVKEWMLNFDYLVESRIEVKNWMLDETLFSDSKEMIEVESWMLDERLFEDKMEILTVQDWMLDVEAFNICSKKS